LNKVIKYIIDHILSKEGIYHAIQRKSKGI